MIAKLGSRSQLSKTNAYLSTADHNGSISAEHGLGVMKAPYINYSQTPESIEVMKKIKTMFDPKGVMVSYYLASYAMLPALFDDSFADFRIASSYFPEPVQIFPLVCDIM